MNDKEVRFYLILFILPFIFNTKSRLVFEDNICPVINGDISPNPLLDYFVLSFTFLIPLYYFLKLILGYSIHYRSFYFLSIFSIWYSTTRFSLNWPFPRTIISNKLSYFDLIPFAFVVCLLFILINGVLLKIKKNKKLKDLDSVDPIVLTPESTLIDKDVYGRESYAKHLSDKFLKSLKLNKTKEAIVVGITGKWGSGKSTFLGMLKKNLEKYDNIILEFNPWRNHNGKNLINLFFDTLSESLGEINPNLSSQINQYNQQLTVVDDNWYFKTFDFINKLIFKVKSIEDLYEDINNTIQEIDRPIIVLIDDLDRLEPSELMEVIKLVRSTSNFKNILFIVAYDKQFVLEGIKTIFPNHFETYLEKIFLSEFKLPGFELDWLYRPLKEKLKNVILGLNDEYIDDLDNYFNSYQNTPNSILRDTIKSMRDVNRFVGLFGTNFSKIHKQVLVSDFLNLELIKFKHEDVYQFIRDYYETFASKVEGDHNLLVTLDMKLESVWKEVMKEDNRINLVKQLFQHHQWDIVDIDADTLYQYFDNNQSKISNVWNERTILSIRAFHNFNNYYHLSEGLESLKPEELYSLLTSDFSEIHKLFIECKNDNNVEAFFRIALSVTHPTSEKAVNNTLNTLFLLGDFYHNESAFFQKIRLKLIRFFAYKLEYATGDRFKKIFSVDEYQTELTKINLLINKSFTFHRIHQPIVNEFDFFYLIKSLCKSYFRRSSADIPNIIDELILFIESERSNFSSQEVKDFYLSLYNDLKDEPISLIRYIVLNPNSGNPSIKAAFVHNLFKKPELFKQYVSDNFHEHISGDINHLIDRLIINNWDSVNYILKEDTRRKFNWLR